MTMSAQERSGTRLEGNFQREGNVIDYHIVSYPPAEHPLDHIEETGRIEPEIGENSISSDWSGRGQIERILWPRTEEAPARRTISFLRQGGNTSAQIRTDQGEQALLVLTIASDGSRQLDGTWIDTQNNVSVFQSHDIPDGRAHQTLVADDPKTSENPDFNGDFTYALDGSGTGRITVARPGRALTVFDIMFDSSGTGSLQRGAGQPAILFGY
jgi:hypothetical protein